MNAARPKIRSGTVLWRVVALVVASVCSLAAKPQCFGQSQSSQAAIAPQALTQAYNQAVKARNWTQAIAIARQLVAQRATAQNLYLLARAQFYSGAIEKSVATYERAITISEKQKPASAKPNAGWKDTAAKIYLGEGDALLKLGRSNEAIEAYSRGAGLSSDPGLASFNACATIYKTGDMDNASEACSRSAEVDASRADSWFMFGSALYDSSPTNSTGKTIITTQTRDALEKYLSLAPEGAHAADVKAMLDKTADD